MLIGCVSMLTLFMLHSTALPGEVVTDGTDLSRIKNIGFLKQPSSALQERFPMCDAFLKVRWIDKEKMVGYSHYEVLVKNKTSGLVEKKRLWALVNMKGVLGINFDAYEFKRERKLDELFQWVREGEVTIGIPMMIRHKGKTISLYQNASLNPSGIG